MDTQISEPVSPQVSSTRFLTDVLIGFFAATVIGSVFVFVRSGRVIPNLYLLLNLAVPLVLCFPLKALAERWAQKGEGRALGLGKMVLGVAALVAVSQGLKAVLQARVGEAVPLLGNWIVLLPQAHVGAEAIVARPLWSTVLFTLVWVTISVFVYYRFLSFHGKNKRLLALAVMLITAYFANLSLERFFDGGIGGYLAVENFAVTELAEIYVMVGAFLHVQAVFSGTGSSLGIVPYLKHELAAFRGRMARIKLRRSER